MTAVLPVPSKSKFRRTIAFTGDSIMDNLSLGNYGFEFCPTQLERYLNTKPSEWINDGLTPQPGVGVDCKVRNFANSGDTSGPYVAATAVANTVTDSKDFTLTSVVGTIAVGSTVLIAGQMAQVGSWNSGTGALGLTILTPTTGLSSGNNYPVYVLSGYGTDILTRLNWVLGNKTPRALELLFPYAQPEWDPPDIACIQIGVNDPGAGQAPHIAGLNLNTTIKSAVSNSAATWPMPGTGAYTQIPLQTGQGANVQVGQTVLVVDWTQTPARPWIGLVCQLNTDTILVSGNTHCLQLNFSAWANYFFGGQNPLPGPLPPVGASVYQGTQANIMAAVLMLQYYGGTQKFLVGNTQYKNYATGSGGDSLATPEPVNATLRPFIAAAVAALQAPPNNGPPVNAQYVDVYSYMRNMVANGSTFSYRGTVYTAVASDSGWHSLAANQHLNPLGGAIVAMAYLGALQSLQQSAGWLDVLRS